MSKRFTLSFVGKISMWAAAVLLVLVLTGCTGAPGMTAREVDRRHVNVTRSNWKMIQDDVDSFLLWDEPSRLTEMPVR